MSEATEKRAHDDAQSRAKFEAWYCRKYGQQTLYRRDMKGSTRFGDYCNHVVQEMWGSWQASRHEALESAIAIAEGFSVLFSTTTAELIAKDIRDLAKSEGEG